MRTILLLLLWATIVGACCFAQSIFCCGSKNEKATIDNLSNANTAIIASSGKVNRANYAISGENNWSINCLEGDFEKSNPNLLADTENRKNCFTKLSEYQKNHQNQKWLITGDYTESEINNTIYRNLGEARAQKVKQVLVNQYGFVPSMLEIEGRKVNEDAFSNDTLWNGYRISRSTLMAENTTSEKATDTSKAETYRFNQVKPITLYFDLNSDNPNMNADIRNRFANLIYDLENHSNLNVHVIGHTDTKGDANYNLKLGQERAESVYEYLVRNGIPSNRIKTSSQGENKPISTIDAENRRAEVTIIKN